MPIRGLIGMTSAAVIGVVVIAFITSCSQPRTLEPTMLNESDAAGWVVEQQAKFKLSWGGSKHVLTIITAPDGQRFLYVSGDDGRGSIAPMREVKKETTMAGSYRMVVNDDGSLRGINLIDDLGDASEAIEEMYDMIQWLTNGDRQKIHEAWLHGHCERRIPDNVKKAPQLFTFASFWER